MEIITRDSEKTIIPKFETAADQNKYFLQAGIRRRLESGILDKRAYIDIQLFSKSAKAINFLNAMNSSRSDSYIVDDKVSVFIDGQDLDQTCENIFDALCESKFKDNEYDLSISIHGAYGINGFYTFGLDCKNSEEIMKVIRSTLEDTKAKGFLVPKDIAYEPEFLAKLEAA